MLQAYYENLFTVLGKNDSTQSSLECADLMQIIPDEIQAIPDTSLGNFDLVDAYNTTKIFYDDQILQLQTEFEDEQQRLIDNHEQRIQNITNKIYAVENKIFEAEREKHSMQNSLGIWKKISETCLPYVIPLEADNDPSICTISSQWFRNFQTILNQKIVLQRNLRENSDCKSKEKWLKDTERSIKKVFRLISAQNVISKLKNSLEEVISELKKIHADTLHQTKRENSQAMSNALRELQKLNLMHRNLKNELEAIKENNRKLLKSYAVALVACPLYKSAVSLITKYDNGNLMEDVISALVFVQGTFNPTSALNFLKSSAFESASCLKVRGLFAFSKLLKLNLHHAAALAEVKNLFLIETQRKLSTVDGECFDLIEFDADVLTRSSGHFETSERCHHLYNCKRYEQFFVSTEAIFETPRVDISCLRSEDVNWFDISENKNVQYLPMNVFRKFPNLEIYYAFKSGVLKINKNNFYGAEKLQGLWLDHNEINTIESGSFNELKSLKWLYLGFNKLISLNTQLFHNLKPLLSLSLEKNRLSTLSVQIFSTLEDLEFLHLNGNPVSSQVTNEYFTNNKKLVCKYILKAHNES